MATRTIQSPGVELNEIDRSQYNKIDYSLPNSPTALITGFASKGEDYALQWMNSKATLDDAYGLPTNEFESYMYNAICEVLNKGGTCIAAKLPYINNAFEKFNYIDYNVRFRKIKYDDLNLDGRYSTIDNIRNTFKDLLAAIKNVDIDGSNMPSISVIASNLNQVIDKYNLGANHKIPESNYRVHDIIECLKYIIDQCKDSFGEMFALYMNDSDLTSSLDITVKSLDKDNTKYGGIDTIQNFDSLLTHSSVLPQNTIRIYDITRSQFDKFDGASESFISSALDPRANDFLGIVPVIVTPANALFFQNMLDFSLDEKINTSSSKALFSQLSTFTSINSTTHSSNNDGFTATVSEDSDELVIDKYLLIPMASINHDSNQAYTTDFTTYDQTNDWTSIESLSRRASMMFPNINYGQYNHFQTDHLKKIGIVVFKAFKDVDNNGKINFEVLESFVGSLDPNSRDPITKANAFIDDVVNNQSQFIRIFSRVDKTMLTKASTITMSCQPAVSIGFYKSDCKKHIDYTQSIARALTRIFDAAQNSKTLPLDIVVDAGVSNIAQLAKTQMIDADDKPRIADYAWHLDDITNDVSGWKTTLKRFDDFVKYTRKDCMFIADGLRTFCLDGNMKIVRKTAPENSVANSILPKLKYMSNTFDSSYTAGYCNWFYQQSYSTTDYLWLPPSIKALGVYIYCDTYFQPWSAPAGLIRGRLTDVVDIAFVPNEYEAGKIYNAQWNYAMYYPIDGITIEGHKTFQSQKTAFDRVNVRRLLLYLERKTSRIANRFVYEGNTEYLRQLFVDTIRPIYEDAVRRDGLREYAIKCDDELNTTDVIENNELRCKIAVKPVKCVDFIVIDFVTSRQSANVSEEILR